MTTTEDVRAYMESDCACGHKRGRHAHFFPSTVSYDETFAVSSIPKVMCMEECACHGFTPAIEMELKGNPMTNPLLAPLIEERLKKR